MSQYFPILSLWKYIPYIFKILLENTIQYKANNIEHTTLSLYIKEIYANQDYIFTYIVKSKSN